MEKDLGRAIRRGMQTASAAPLLFLLSGCLFSGGNDPAPLDPASAPVFASFQAGTTWQYEIRWIRSGSCIGDRIRTIAVAAILSGDSGYGGNETRRIVYQWSDSAKTPDSAADSHVYCDSVPAGYRYDTVAVGADSRYRIPDTVSDAKAYGDLRQMSFFQLKRIPADTDSVALCDGMKTVLNGSVRDEGTERRAILDTSACLSGSGGVVSFARYWQDVGLVKKQWGYSDEGVLIDFTSVTLLEFNGRRISPE